MSYGDSPRPHLSTRQIRSLRPPKPAVDPSRPLEVIAEEERWGDGSLAPSLAVFLAGAECPFTCVFCDLWRFTLDDATPAGALPAQLRRALEEHPPPDHPRARIKLYNASNFFEPRAVPPEDLAALARGVDAFPHVTVENHPRLVGPACRDFARQLGGRLEVALGLETVHAPTLAKLNKGARVEDFDRAAEALAGWGVDLRAFVLLGPPFQAPADRRRWTRRSVRHALGCGARLVALNPVRGGYGAMETLRNRGDWRPPTAAEIEATFDDALALAAEAEPATDGNRPVVVLDLWDVEQFFPCSACAGRRLRRLEQLNREGRPLPRVTCSTCADGSDAHDDP